MATRRTYSRDNVYKLFDPDSYWEKFFRLPDQMIPRDQLLFFQYYTAEKNYDHYIMEHAPILRRKAFAEWGDQFIAFQSLCRLCSNCA
ncbi:MAG TPA: hypothetical protein VMY77_05030 [Chitinophagaceae bacterium]|nr:hypothetical protein [Chitinophagaceae bacterium]